MFSSYSPWSSPYSYSSPNPYSYSAYADPYQAAIEREQQRRRQLQAAQQAQLRAQAQRQAAEQQRRQAQAQAQRRAAHGWFPPRSRHGAYHNPYAAYGYEDPDEDSDEVESDDMRYDYGLGHAPVPPPDVDAQMQRGRQPSPHSSTQAQEGQGRRTKIAVRSPSRPPAPAVPARVYTEEEVQAATKIQSAVRVHLSHKRISSIHSKLISLTSPTSPDAFTFPEVIDFQDISAPNPVEAKPISIHSDLTAPNDAKPGLQSAARPRLAYTKDNRPLLAQIEALSRLLTELDSVESWGDAGVRTRRKEVVREVEAALEELEGDEEDEKDLRGWRGVWRKFVKKLDEPQDSHEARDADTEMEEETPTLRATSPPTASPEVDVDVRTTTEMEIDPSVTASETTSSFEPQTALEPSIDAGRDELPDVDDAILVNLRMAEAESKGNSESQEQTEESNRGENLGEPTDSAFGEFVML